MVVKTLKRAALWEVQTPQVRRHPAGARRRLLLPVAAAGRRGEQAVAACHGGRTGAPPACRPGPAHPGPHASLPQVIRPPLLREGFALVAEKGLEVTDDVSIVEALGKPVRITPGAYTNIKARMIEGAAGGAGAARVLAVVGAVLAPQAVRQPPRPAASSPPPPTLAHASRPAPPSCTALLYCQVTTPDDMSVAERFLEEAAATARAAGTPGEQAPALSLLAHVAGPDAPAGCTRQQVSHVADRALSHLCQPACGPASISPAQPPAPAGLHSSPPDPPPSRLPCACHPPADPLEAQRVDACEADPSQPECRVYDD